MARKVNRRRRKTARRAKFTLRAVFFVCMVFGIRMGASAGTALCAALRIIEGLALMVAVGTVAAVAFE